MGTALAAYFLAVFVPFLGVFGMLAMADLLLLGVSCLLASFFWRRPALALGVALLAWVALGLNGNLTSILPWQLDPYDSAPVVRIERSLDTRTLRTISLTGDAVPLLAAAGRPRDFMGEVTAGGTLDNIRALADQPRAADIADMLWNRGLTPEVNGSSYPAVHVERSEHGDHFTVTLTVLAAADEVTGTYRRRLWYPNRHRGSIRTPPGRQIAAAVRLSLSCNLWKVLLSHCPRAQDVEAEVDQFLAATLGRTAPERRIGTHGPLRQTLIEAESVVDTGDAEGARELLVRIDQEQSMRLVTSEDHSVCNPAVAQLAIGAPGWQGMPLVVMPDGSARPRRWLDTYSYGARASIVHCDVRNRRFVTFFSLPDVTTPNLRIRVFDSGWKLVGAYYLRLPLKEKIRSLLVAPDSFVISGSGDIRFATVSPVATSAGNSGQQYLRRTYYSAGQAEGAEQGSRFPLP